MAGHLAFCLTLLTLLFAGAAQGHEGHDHSETSSATATNTSSAVTPSSSPTGSMSTFTNPLEAVFATPGLSYLQYAILVSGLEGSFVAPEPGYTILAPSNEAWGKTNGVDFLKSQRLGGILAYHTIPNVLTTSELRNGSTLMTLWGLTLGVTNNGSSITFSGAANNATVIVPNIRAGKNIIHIVDNLLDRRNNAAIDTPEAKATLAKIKYNTMLQYPAQSPGSSPPVVAVAG